MNEDGPIFTFGDTNMRTRFTCGAREFCDRWSEAGPTHHMAAASGRWIDTILKVAKIFNVPVDVITRYRKRITMKDILTSPEIVELVRTLTNMYAHGWDERNGGNVSVLLDGAELAEYLDLSAVLRTIPTGFAAPELEGRYFLVTGTGKYFKNVQYDPANNLGIVRLT